jgi:hypothetical protein
MATLVKVRNELVHYKSKWGQSMDRSSLFTDRLPQLKLKKPPFVDEKHHFFPHKFLSAACASWATGTAVTFILDFYGRLGIPNPLNPHMEHFKDL